MKIKVLFFLLFLNICFFGQNDTLKYIFIGHAYQERTDGDKVDYRLEKLDFSPYSGIWLGGDVCSEASLKYSTIEYIDKIFNLSDPMTFWALGNHDTRDGNWEWIKEFTHRETFYTYTFKGITYIVLNTNILPNNCFLLDQQWEIIKNVCDTIQKSSHLILLMHHGIWTDVPGLPPNPGSYCHGNLKYWNANCDDVNSNFVNAVYPKLVNVKNRGIQVICIMGDVGASKKYLDFISDDGIYFLGCGLYHNSDDDRVLIFTHIPAQRKLTWEYVYINDLLK